MERGNKKEALSVQMKKKASQPVKAEKEYDGDFGTVISTGSTLLDLAISGGVVRGGGIPGGILVEAFGPNGSGKTILLCELAGDVQRKGGETQFHDAESRLNNGFAQLFGFKVNDKDYFVPDKVPEVFEAVRNWTPEKKGTIHGVFADSLAALSTALEMDDDEGDKPGETSGKG